MPAMADFRYINAALTRIGDDPITSLGSETAGSRIAAENYETLIVNELSSYRWRWATKTATLNLLGGTPAPPWTYAYQRPPDVLALRVVEVEGDAVDYEVQFDKILTDQSEAAQVIAKYTWRPPEANWPGFFAEAIIQRLESLFLRAVAHRYDEAEAREKSALRAMSRARLMDAQSHTAGAPVTSPTLEARRA
ncbi:MAG: hypothetical protein IT337_15205 [Thermomicrobiales bacterium]|nr:hypothetical protein [Thermomicrobiales bacterium]